MRSRRWRAVSNGSTDGAGGDPQRLVSMNLHELDARNLLCPLPVIRVQDKVKGLAAGDVLEVVCTDPGVTSDIPAWCRINGHKVLTTRTRDHEIVIRIEVGSLDG